MASVLKHTQCPACGHRHHFCFLGPVLVPGRAYEFICPENAKKAILRPTSAGEAVKVPPQGAIALDERTTQGGEESGHPKPSPSAEGKSGPMQEVLPEIKDLAMKVGGIDRLDEVVKTVKEMNK